VHWRVAVLGGDGEVCSGLKERWVMSGRVMSVGDGVIDGGKEKTKKRSEMMRW
jgi:hypothetical protein